MARRTDRIDDRLRRERDDLLKRAIGVVIRRERQTRGLRQGDLGYTKAQVSAIEVGKIWPSLPAFQLIAEQLGISASDLLALIEDEVVKSKHRE